MRKYLKTPEEVIDALHEGKTVFGCGETYRLYKGVVVGQLEDGRYLINTSIFKHENLYIEEPEPFKIEVGKFYKTRAGEKARCFSIDLRLAYFTVDEKLSAFSTYMAGNVFNSKEPCEYDIIGPWEE